MFNRDKWQEIFHSLRSNKLRTTLTAFGVSWGIFMLLIMLGAGTGLENGVKQDFGNLAKNSLYVWCSKTTLPYKGFPRGRNFVYKLTDMEYLKEKIPGIDIICPRTGSPGMQKVIYNNKKIERNVRGEYPQLIIIDPFDITSGRYINHLDIRDNRKVMVIGDIARQELFAPDEDPIGKYVQVSGTYFKVIGTFKSRNRGRRAENQEKEIHLPYTTLSLLYGYGPDIGNMIITSKKGVLISSIEEHITAELRRRRDIHPDDQAAVGHFNIEKEFMKFINLFLGIKVLIWVVGIGTLLSGIIGISNIMLVIVRERTKEIGIQRALGAKPFVIINQIITESVFLTSIAGFLGLMFGVFIIELLNKILLTTGKEDTMFTNPEVDFRIVISAIIILVICGALAGLIPAKRAIKIRPIEALRTEI